MSLLEESDTTDLIDRIDLPSVLSLPLDSREGPARESVQGSKLKKKSVQFPPPSSNPNISTFLKLVHKEIERLHIRTPREINTNVADRQALKELSDNKSIVIKPSDKGGERCPDGQCSIHFNVPKNSNE